MTRLSQCGQPTGQLQVSSHGPSEVVRGGQSRPRALEAEQGGRMPVTNEDLFKVTLASGGSETHTRVYSSHSCAGRNPCTRVPSSSASTYPVPITAGQPSVHPRVMLRPLSPPGSPTTKQIPRNEDLLLSGLQGPRTTFHGPQRGLSCCLFSSFLSQTKLFQRKTPSGPLQGAEQCRYGRGLIVRLQRSGKGGTQVPPGLWLFG